MTHFEARFLQSNGSQIGDIITIDRNLRVDAIDRAMLLAKDISPKPARLEISHDGQVIENLTIAGP